MTKAGTLIFVLFAVLLFPLASWAVEISDLKVSGLDGVKANEKRASVYTFTSSEQPEDVVMDISGIVGSQSIRKQARWKNKEMEVKVEKAGASYRVSVARGFQAPHRGGVSAEIEIWVLAGGKESNKLKMVVKIDD